MNSLCTGTRSATRLFFSAKVTNLLPVYSQNGVIYVTMTAECHALHSGQHGRVLVSLACAEGSTRALYQQNRLLSMCGPMCLMKLKPGFGVSYAIRPRNTLGLFSMGRATQPVQGPLVRPPSRSRKPLRLAEDILRLASRRRLAGAYG